NSLDHRWGDVADAWKDFPGLPRLNASGRWFESVSHAQNRRKTGVNQREELVGLYGDSPRSLSRP
ncbi:MAG: hypothetical protein ACIALR_08135, partial [Blastopirellula sp. JB062]